MGRLLGQVNGLAVYQMGDFSFGKPSRITAKTFMGRGGIVNIERESKLSGKTHDKGVLILERISRRQVCARTAVIAFQPASASSSLTMVWMATARHPRNCTLFFRVFRKFLFSKVSP